MLELISTEKLNADELKIWRVKTDTPTEGAVRFLRFIQGTTGNDNPRNGRRDLSYWRIYFHDAFAGKNYPEVIDYFYCAEVNGEIAARMWFAYAPASNFGNFGNILTVPEFRRRGILRRLMPHFLKDFEESPAKCLACATGTPFAARTYMDYGLKLIYPGTTGSMALVKPEWGSFNELDARLFADAAPIRFRPGVLGDQFRIDKFLRYCRAFHEEPPRSQLMDYRCCMQETLNGNGRIAVAENAAGAPVGFAWTGFFDGLQRMTFLLHPGAGDAGTRFLREFGSGPDRPVFIQEAGDERSRSWMQSASAVCRCSLTGGAAVWQFEN